VTGAHLARIVFDLIDWASSNAVATGTAVVEMPKARSPELLETVRETRSDDLLNE
jgi:hypothetical protein